MDFKIKIVSGGPYIVTGGLPLSEKIILQKGGRTEYIEGRTFKLQKMYALCRCGKSKNPPFCDGAHAKFNFSGAETASKKSVKELAQVYKGSNITLYDQENLCAFARFCHTEDSDIWEIMDGQSGSLAEEQAITLACDCPAGRLVMVDNRTGEDIEPLYPPSIVILQDPSRKCSGPIWVRGGVPLESADGSLYQTRNRMTLCRCGQSNNKPFCDALHVADGFVDEEKTLSECEKAQAALKEKGDI